MKILRFVPILPLLVACGGRVAVTPTSTITPLPLVTLQAYAPSTPSPEAARTPQVATPLPTPTPTPFIYTVVKDDTLLGIAARFGLSVDDLLAVNPGIDPRLLTIGLTLTIPLAPDGNVPDPQVLQIPLVLGPPRCFPLPDASRWCIVQVSNPNDFPVSTVSLLWTLSEDEFLSGVLPMDILPPGVSLPAGMILPPGATLRDVRIRSALPARQPATRWPQQRAYDKITPPLPACRVSIQNITTPPEGSAPTALTWLVIGYDEGKQPLAYCQGTQPWGGVEEMTYTCSLTAPQGMLTDIQVWEAWDVTDSPK